VLLFAHCDTPGYMFEAVAGRRKEQWSWAGG
jgi:hypothetical protein